MIRISPFHLALTAGVLWLAWYTGEPGISLGVIGTLIARLGPGDLLRETILGNDTFAQLTPLPPQTGTLSTSTTAWGIGFPKIVTGNMTGYGYIGFFEIPTGSTMTTGITVYITTTDSGEFASDLGLATSFGIQVRLVSAATCVNTYGTATTHTITMAATTGTTVKTAFAITNANMNSAGAGDIVMMRIYRAGSVAADTAQGRVLMLPSVTVEDT